MLTTRRLILVDSKKHLIAPQEILLATLRDIEPGENAIRDPTIALSIITNTGATRQMILTFSKTSGERQRECDEWVKALRHQITSAVQHAIMPDIQTPEGVPSFQTDAPVPQYRAESPGTPVSHSPKRKIEIARPGPMKKIVETPPSIPQPVETTSLPTGSFCNRCGSRVPPESAFCNKCGTPVVTESDLAAQMSAASHPVSSVPQVQVHSPMPYSADKTERPIEDVIHSIEPLIEDSVPRRREPAPLVPKQHGQQQPVVPAVPVQPATAPVTESPAAPETAAAPLDPQVPALGTPDVKWPVIGSPETPAPGTPAEPVPSAAVPAPAADSPGSPPPAAPKSRKGLVMGAIALVIIVIIAAVFIFANPLGGSTGPGVTTTLPATTPATAVPTTLPQAPVVEVEETTSPAVTAATTTASTGLAVPGSGVWVRVSYIGEYEGSVGTPGTETEVTGSGEKLFQIPTS
ncbi:MAG: zinc ribbon domain-containing protein, partial [Methanoregula sp.]|nr:zinc ribbon domain-containing protein [Methanoregula sp.]